MALVGKTTRKTIPHEPGAWIEFRELSGREMDEADRENTKASFLLFKDIDPAALKAAREGQQTAAADPRDGYDKDTLCKYGIVAWSYEEPCLPASVEKLDAQTRDWASSVILDMNLRAPGEDSASARS